MTGPQWRVVEPAARASVGRGKLHLAAPERTLSRTLCGREVGAGWEARRYADAAELLASRRGALCERCAASASSA